MALVTPEITALTPSNTITIVIAVGHTSGISGDYNLSVRLLHDEGIPLDVHVTLNILDSGLFRFENDFPYKEFAFKNIIDKQIISLGFKIKNPVPLEDGFPLRLRVIANAVITPDSIMAVSENWPVTSN